MCLRVLHWPHPLLCKFPSPNIKATDPMCETVSQFSVTVVTHIRCQIRLQMHVLLIPAIEYGEYSTAQHSTRHRAGLSRSQLERLTHPFAFQHPQVEPFMIMCAIIASDSVGRIRSWEWKHKDSVMGSVGHANKESLTLTSLNYYIC